MIQNHLYILNQIIISYARNKKASSISASLAGSTQANKRRADIQTSNDANASETIKTKSRKKRKKKEPEILTLIVLF